MIRASDIERLSRDLILAAADRDVIGIRSAFLGINDLDDVDRSKVLGYVDRLGARAIAELADHWGVTPAQALDRLIAERWG